MDFDMPLKINIDLINKIIEKGIYDLAKEETSSWEKEKTKIPYNKITVEIVRKGTVVTFYLNDLVIATLKNSYSPLSREGDKLIIEQLEGNLHFDIYQ